MTTTDTIRSTFAHETFEEFQASVTDDIEDCRLGNQDYAHFHIGGLRDLMKLSRAEWKARFCNVSQDVQRAVMA